jgi:hypothetical protein
VTIEVDVVGVHNFTPKKKKKKKSLLVSKHQICRYLFVCFVFGIIEILGA